MYKLILFLIFLTINHISADSIRDYEIEGISIGDTALSIVSKNEIIKEIKKNNSAYSYLKNPEKFGEVYYIDEENFTTYEVITFFVKPDDKNYEIFMIRGVNYMEVNKCLKEREIISKDIENILKNYEKDSNERIPRLDDKSKTYNLVYYMKSGDSIVIQCNDWSKQTNYQSGISVSILTKEFSDWINEN